MPRFLIPQGAVMLYHYNEDDLEHYVLEAYRKSFFFGNAPDFYELWDNFIDEIMLSCRVRFYFDGIAMSRYEVDENMFNFILVRLNIEFINYKGDHLNDCQNIINKEWLE
jgi:hypothetical protein